MCSVPTPQGDLLVRSVHISGLSSNPGVATDSSTSWLVGANSLAQDVRTG